MKAKSIRLSLDDYLKKLQYLYDEGFTIDLEENIKTLTMGIRVIETNERYWFDFNQVKKRCDAKELFDPESYHGPVKTMIEGMNIIIAKYYDAHLNNLENILKEINSHEKNKKSNCKNN